MNKQEYLLDILNKTITPATGCTEPVAVAYSSAVAREQMPGEIESLIVYVDAGVYKNGMSVGIPGIKERGLKMAAALGALIGDSGSGLRIFEGISDTILVKAKRLVEEKRITIKVKRDFNRLYVESILTTSKGKVRTITIDKHINVVSIEKGDNFPPYHLPNTETNNDLDTIKNYTFEEIMEFVVNVPINQIDFLKNGLAMNLAVTRDKMKDKNGLCAKMLKMVNEGDLRDDMQSRAQILCAAASEARMSGSRFPVMSCTGSGNHGITVFLINAAVAEKNNTPEEVLLRALALSILITAYIKAYTGMLSVMCGCGVAAGIGAAGGVAYQLGAKHDTILGTLMNMVGSITGMICDGGKEGCAYKLALTAGWAVQSALLAINGAVINKHDGIVTPQFRELLANLGGVCNPGMVATNEYIIKAMERNYNRCP